MTDLFTSVKLLLKPRRPDTFNFTFNLHTKYTVGILLASSLLLSAQFAREPITCLPGSRLLQEKMMDTFCWVNGTFTIPADHSSLSPGVGPGYHEAPRRYQHYYQWLSIVLLLQASLFYLPRYVWKMWEGGVLMSLLPDDTNQQSAAGPDQANKGQKGVGGGAAAVAVEDVSTAKGQNQSYSTTGDKGGSVICAIGVEQWENGCKNSQLSQLLKFFRHTSCRRKAYVTKFLACELLNSCNVLGQLVLINYFFDDAFLYYGYNVMRFLCGRTKELGFTISPMDELFPKLAKCTFYKYGPSGTMEAVDALCILGWNVVYEKIYFIMWWWFVVLIVFTFVNLASRFVAFFCRCCRFNLLKNEALFSKPDTVQDIVRKADFADVFVLCKISRQLKPELFNEFLEELRREWRMKSRNF